MIARQIQMPVTGESHSSGDLPVSAFQNAVELTPEGDGVVSFTDETTPRDHASGFGRVIVAAQWFPHHPLDWYYDLVKQISVDGELKSQTVLERLPDLSYDLRESVWNGARLARIHIVDPRPYVMGLRHELLDSGDDWMLRSLNEPTPAGQKLRELEAEFVAADVLWNSRAEQLARYIDVVLMNGWVDVIGAEQLSEMHHKLRYQLDNKLNHTLLFAARSASVFANALEEVASPHDGWSLQAYSNLEKQRIGAELRKKHAFDRGNTKVLGILESLRREFSDLMDYDPFALTQSEQPSCLIELDSVLSEPVRAADIAAGLAAYLYKEDRLVEVVRRFEYVEHNGTRMTEALASAETARIRAAKHALARMSS
ncbi:MAG TPA: hypothetical protein VFJ82_18895 [Longimicrobium sp.]|nr:hypothetical protein [Longimicrobium sp.]